MDIESDVSEESVQVCVVASQRPMVVQSPPVGRESGSGNIIGAEKKK
ncbi:MAG TPA: hypothetical protein VJC13_01585 [Candidatus Paceibacterota bacterium]